MRVTKMLVERRVLNHWEKELAAVLCALQEEQGTKGVTDFVEALTSQDDNLAQMPDTAFKGDRMAVARHKSIRERGNVLLANRKVVSKSVNWLEIAIELCGTQAAVAKALHVTPAYISKWLRQRAGLRNTPYKHVERLSDLTGLPIRALGSVGKEATEKLRRVRAI